MKEMKEVIPTSVTLYSCPKCATVVVGRRKGCAACGWRAEKPQVEKKKPARANSKVKCVCGHGPFFHIKAGGGCDVCDCTGFCEHRKTVPTSET